MIKESRKIGLFIFVFLLIANIPSLLFSADKRPVILGFEGALSDEGVPAGWKLKERSGKAEYRVLMDGGEKVLFFRGMDASFSMERKIKLDVREYPYIKWRWKVMLLPEGGDVRYRGKNDQAAQVIVLFDRGRAISYIWDTTAPEGAIMEESVPWPFSIKIKVLVVKSGVEDIRQWIIMRRNIYEDYKRLFNEEPGVIKGVRIQINSQHTGTIGEAFFGSIIFEPAQ
ncbi:MAG: DUF3047 domain-containing protein [Nitrospirae bacterium]|nr:DUF3047 domain-containing protein [Nitrospirota bacterium]